MKTDRIRMESGSGCHILLDFNFNFNLNMNTKQISRIQNFFYLDVTQFNYVHVFKVKIDK